MPKLRKKLDRTVQNTPTNMSEKHPKFTSPGCLTKTQLNESAPGVQGTLKTNDPFSTYAFEWQYHIVQQKLWETFSTLPGIYKCPLKCSKSGLVKMSLGCVWYMTPNGWLWGMVGDPRRERKERENERQRFVSWLASLYALPVQLRRDTWSTLVETVYVGRSCDITWHKKMHSDCGCDITWHYLALLWSSIIVG